MAQLFELLSPLGLGVQGDQEMGILLQTERRKRFQHSTLKHDMDDAFHSILLTDSHYAP
jgi:hypothetical protein